MIFHWTQWKVMYLGSVGELPAGVPNGIEEGERLKETLRRID